MTPSARADEPGRWISFERCANARDLGGYRTSDGRSVRWRRLYRGARTTHMTAADVGRCRHDLALATVVDLRSRSEVRRDGRSPLEGTSIRLVRAALELEPGQLGGAGDARPLWSVYLQTLHACAPALASILELLGREESYPALLCCTAGKDRTGIVAALVLSLVGVPDEIVAGEYALSDRAGSPWCEEERLATRRRLRAQGLPEELALARAESMLRMLDGVGQTHGSVAAYALAIGLSPDALDRLRCCLT